MSKATKKAGKRSASKTQRALKEMPEVDFTKSVPLGRGLYAGKIARDGGYYVQPAGEPARFVQTRQGRPKKSEPKATTQTKNVRLPPELWAAIERIANGQGLSLHAAMRQAMIEWLGKRAKVA
jgi:hypothetical protein